MQYNITIDMKRMARNSTCVNQDDSLLDQSFITNIIRIKIKRP